MRNRILRHYLTTTQAKKGKGFRIKKITSEISIHSGPTFNWFPSPVDIIDFSLDQLQRGLVFIWNPKIIKSEPSKPSKWLGASRGDELTLTILWANNFEVKFYGSNHKPKLFSIMFVRLLAMREKLFTAVRNEFSLRDSIKTNGF